MASELHHDNSTGTCRHSHCDCDNYKKEGGDMKPLFIPLKTEYYNAFLSGEKKTEYRKYGPRWNEKTCIIGRPVTLSCGYGKKRRIQGGITGFKKVPVLQSKGGAAYWLCYGRQDIGPVAEIDIEVLK